MCRDSKVTAQLSKQLRDGVIMEVNAFSADHRPMPIFSRVDRFVVCLLCLARPQASNNNNHFYLYSAIKSKRCNCSVALYKE